MIRVLVLIAVAGFLAGVVALAGAAALGGPELAARNWEWFIFDHDRGHHRRDRDDSPARVAIPDEGVSATREMAWDGSSRAVFELPAVIEYTQGTDAKLTISGPRDVVQRVKLAGGKLTLDGPLDDDDRLRIVMTAPGITRFEVGGDNRLEVRSFRQDRLEIAASGSSEVSVEGQTKALALELSGSSEADLSRLSADSADADVSGTAEATIAPRDTAHLEVSGSASVKLTTRPKHLDTDVAGAGAVTFEDGATATGTEAPARREPRNARDA